MGICFAGCSEKSEETKYNFKNIAIAPASYSILLDENINERIVRIPLLFEYQALLGEIQCSVESIEGTNTTGLDVSCKSITFGIDKNTEYLIPNIDLSVKFVGKGNFSQKTITSLSLKIADTTIKSDVNINIYDRATYGIYNNLDSYTTTNIGYINVINANYTDGTTMTANKSVMLKSIEYIDGSLIDEFELSLIDYDTQELELKSKNNIAINTVISSGQTFEAVWKLSVPTNCSFWGVETVVKYVYNEQTYIDTYIICNCYIEIINSIIEGL